MKLKNVLIFAIEGRDSAEAIKKTHSALLYSIKDIEFGSAIFCGTDFSCLEKDSRIDYIKLKSPMDYANYNRFMIKDLYSIVSSYKCSHILCIQDDGFVVNPECWKPEYLNYDYIGAPWSEKLMMPVLPEKELRVGNGGFSLRSMKFLEICSKYIPWPFFQILQYAPIIQKYTGGRYNPTWDLYNEDRILCFWYREVLLAHGITFAPAELAIHFSFENPFEGERDLVTKDTFGFHGKHTPLHQKYLKVLENV